MKASISTSFSLIPFLAGIKPIKLVYFLSALILFTACGNDDESGPRSLKFEEVAFIEGRALPQATGLAGSEQLDALYIASREANESLLFAERVIRYDLSTGEQVVSSWVQPDFISKNVHVLNGDLIVVGGTRVNTYSVDLNVDPDTATHGLRLSRFGSAIYDDELIVWGGDLDQQTSSHIRRWNFDDKRFTTIGEFPTATTWAHGEIVDNKLYSFGGQEQFANTPSTDLIYVYDFQSDVVNTFFLPESMTRTFTARYQDKIYVAGHVIDENGVTNTVLGIFNTNNNEFRTLQYTATYKDEIDPDLLDIIQILQMTVVGNKLYVLLGPVDANVGVFLHVANL